MKKMIKKLSAVALAAALTVTTLAAGSEVKAASHDFRNAYGRTVYTVGCTNNGGSVATSVSAFSTKHQTSASASGTLYYYNKNGTIAYKDISEVRENGSNGVVYVSKSAKRPANSKKTYYTTSHHNAMANYTSFPVKNLSQYN